MQVLITGASGFVGHRLSTYLLNKGISVIEGNSKNCNLSNKKILRELISKSDVVIHLAVYQNLFDEKYIKFYKVNVLGTKNLLEIAKRYKKKVILLSSEVVNSSNNDFYTKSKKEQLELAKAYKNIEIIYPAAVLDLNQKLPWWRIAPGGIMKAIGYKEDVVNYVLIEDLCENIYDKLRGKDKELKLYKCTRKEYLNEIKKKTRGFVLPYLISPKIIKIFAPIIQKTKYKNILKII